MESVPLSYFVQLPAECLELIVQLVYENNVIQVMGDICMDTTTRSLDSHGGLSLLFSQANPFRCVVSSMFTRLVFDRSTKYGRRGIGPGRYNLVAPHCTKEEIKISPESDVGLDTGLIRQVFRICGPSIESMLFGVMEFNGNTMDSEYENTRTPHKFSSLVLQHCANIKHLSFLQEERFRLNWIAEELVFHKFATQLKSLTLGSDFPTTMSGLGECSSLRELRYMKGCNEHLIQLLLCVGGTLEQLCIENQDPDYDCEKFLEVTRKTCNRLHTFSVNDYAQLIALVRKSRYDSFLCSYGDQLIRANLSYLNPEALQKVIDACPRLDFGSCWSFLGLPESPKCVSVLGPRLQSLRLFTPVVPANEWATILAECTNLRELDLRFDMSLAQLPTLLHLERFDLHRMCVSAQFISHLASISSNLRSVNVLISSNIQTGYIFKPLVKSNKFLRDVRIREHVSQQQPRTRPHARCSLQLLRELVETFSKCHKLDIGLFQTQGEYITSSEVSNICSVLPCRGVEARIGIRPHVFYEQTGKLRY